MDIQKAQSELGDQVCRDLLFVHAMLGCDATSRLFGFGKAVGLKLIQTNQTFIEQAPRSLTDQDAHRLKLLPLEIKLPCACTRQLPRLLI
jgi:hypothetical protein